MLFVAYKISYDKPYSNKCILNIISKILTSNAPKNFNLSCINDYELDILNKLNYELFPPSDLL